MASLLLKNGYIITVNGNRDVIRNGWIRIEGDSIRGIGPMENLPSGPGHGADETIDLHGMIVIPGLINGHNHHWASLFKNTGEGLLLEPWLDQVTIPLMLQLTAEDIRIAAYLGALEQIRTGTTCSLNHVVNVNSAETMAAMIEPVVHVGIRQLVTKEVRNYAGPAVFDGLSGLSECASPERGIGVRRIDHRSLGRRRRAHPYGARARDRRQLDAS